MVAAALFPLVTDAQDVASVMGNSLREVRIQLEAKYGYNVGNASSLDEIGLGNREAQIVRKFKALSLDPSFSKVPSSDWSNALALTLIADSAWRSANMVTTSEGISAFPTSKPEPRVRVIVPPSSFALAFQQVKGAQNIQKVANVDIALPDDGIKRSRDKTIYGVDDRREFFQIPTLEAKNLARGVASISGRPERSVHARGYCTAFLIAPDRALTAGHCVNKEDYPIKVLRFGDHIIAAGRVPSGSLESFDIEDVEVWDYMHDLAIVKIKPNPGGRLPGAIYPVLALSSQHMVAGAAIYMLGHPGSDYLKFAPCRVVKETYHNVKYGKVSFGVDCDAFGGNSGSPIVDARTNQVVGFLWGGQQDSRVIPQATDELHEFAVPLEAIKKATGFDLGNWPSAIAIARNESRRSSKRASGTPGPATGLR
jgi:hypothetical protein